MGIFTLLLTITIVLVLVGVMSLVVSMLALCTSSRRRCHLRLHA